LGESAEWSGVGPAVDGPGTDRDRTDARAIADANYCKASSIVDGIELTDAPFFGLSPKDAAIMDPQHRVFLECAWQALEKARWSADEFPGPSACLPARG
jgi:acyl transferase domain-containing protein